MIISNATPLIAFSRIGRLDLLRETVAEPLVIPEAVAGEISDYERGEAGSIDLANEAWIQTQSVEDEQQLVGPWRQAVLEDLQNGPRLLAGIGELFEERRIDGIASAFAELRRQLDDCAPRSSAGAARRSTVGDFTIAF